jgi:hypothetical protein
VRIVQSAVFYHRHVHLPTLEVQDSLYGSPASQIPVYGNYEDETLFATKTDDARNVFSKGVLVNAYTGKAYEVLQENLPPPTTTKGNLLDFNKPHPRLQVLNEGYSSKGFRQKQEVLGPTPMINAGPPVLEDEHAYDRRLQIEQFAQRDLFNNWNGNVPAQALIGETPFGYKGYNNMIRILPYMPPTQEISRRGWTAIPETEPPNYQQEVVVQRREIHRVDDDQLAAYNMQVQQEHAAHTIHPANIELRPTQAGNATYMPAPGVMYSEPQCQPNIQVEQRQNHSNSSASHLFGQGHAYRPDTAVSLPGEYREAHRTGGGAAGEGVGGTGVASFHNTSPPTMSDYRVGSRLNTDANIVGIVGGSAVQGGHESLPSVRGYREPSRHNAGVTHNIPFTSHTDPGYGLGHGTSPERSDVQLGVERRNTGDQRSFHSSIDSSVNHSGVAYLKNQYTHEGKQVVPDGMNYPRINVPVQNTLLHNAEHSFPVRREPLPMVSQQVNILNELPSIATSSSLFTQANRKHESFAHAGTSVQVMASTPTNIQPDTYTFSHDRMTKSQVGSIVDGPKASPLSPTSATHVQLNTSARGHEQPHQVGRDMSVANAPFTTASMAQFVFPQERAQDFATMARITHELTSSGTQPYNTSASISRNTRQEMARQDAGRISVNADGSLFNMGYGAVSESANNTSRGIESNAPRVMVVQPSSQDSLPCHPFDEEQAKRKHSYLGAFPITTVSYMDHASNFNYDPVETHKYGGQAKQELLGTSMGGNIHGSHVVNNTSIGERHTDTQSIAFPLTAIDPGNPTRLIMMTTDPGRCSHQERVVHHGEHSSSVSPPQNAGSLITNGPRDNNHRASTSPTLGNAQHHGVSSASTIQSSQYRDSHKLPSSMPAVGNSQALGVGEYVKTNVVVIPQNRDEQICYNIVPSKIHIDSGGGYNPQPSIGDRNIDDKQVFT